MAVNPKHNAGHDVPIHASAFPSEDTFKLVAETRKQVDAVADSARKAIRTFYTDPNLLAGFIERHGTPVYILRGGMTSQLALWALGFEPGFIPPVSGRRYEGLKKLLTAFGYTASGEKPSGIHGRPHYRHGVFVLTPAVFTVGFMSHQLHHWLACRSGMAGYSEQSQRLYKKFWVENRGVLGPEIYKMDAEGILALKAAINRDLEALRFLKSIASEVLIPAKQARRIGSGDASA